MPTYRQRKMLGSLYMIQRFYKRCHRSIKIRWRTLGPYYYRCTGVDAISAKFDGLVKAAERELSRTSVSGFRRHNNAIFEKAVLDAIYRKQLFDEAFLVRLST